MAEFQKFYCFVEDRGRGVHDLDRDTLRIALSNKRPSPTDRVIRDIVQIPLAGGYRLDGNIVESTRFFQQSGVAKLTGRAVRFQADGSGVLGPFEFAVLYNATALDGALIGWMGYGEPITLKGSDVFLIGKDGDGNDWDWGSPLLEDR